MRASQDPKYQHLQEDLHVEITAFAPPAEAHARIAFALTEVRKYLIPDSNDEIRQEQMRELELISGDSIIDNLKASQTAAAAALLLSPSFANIGYSAQQPAGVTNTLMVNNPWLIGIQLQMCSQNVAAIAKVARINVAPMVHQPSLRVSQHSGYQP